MTSEPTTDAVCRLADQHGLALDPGTVRFNEAGLDYRVAFATDPESGEEWVLRIPRRPDVSAKIAEEKQILNFIAPRLDTAAPDWRISSTELIAYPLLPGKPGLTLDDAGQPVWHFDPASLTYAESLGQVIASLHEVDVHAAAEAGVPSESPEQLRQRWADDLNRVVNEFSIDPDLMHIWRSWIDDDDLWPQRSVFTHGELYPAHLLLDEESRILSALDWTTAKVSDPALDFMYQFLIAPPESFTRTVNIYRDLTGNEEPNLAARCSALTAVGPLNYALFALQSGEPQHRATAEAQLNPNRARRTCLLETRMKGPLMAESLTAEAFEVQLRALATEEQRIKYQRFFPGDDSFVGVRMGAIFALAKQNLAMPVAGIESLLESETHEVRVGACSIMGKAAAAKKVSPERHRELYELYLRRHDRIDPWDLVDLAAYQVVGSWLIDKPRVPLHDLAASSFWPERRSAIVATAAFLGRGEISDTLRIASALSTDQETLVQKGVGWMLRYVGDIDEAALLTFLDEHGARMARIAVRAATEKLDKPTRDRYAARAMRSL